MWMRMPSRWKPAFKTIWALILDIVDLVMSLEEEFDCEIPDEEIENIKTVGDIVKYIEDHQ